MISFLLLEFLRNKYHLEKRKKGIMEVFIQRMSHVADQIFEHLDNKTLVNCKEVSKPWQIYIEKKNFSWIRIVDIPRVEIGEFLIKNAVLHIAAETGQSKIFKMILENEGGKNPMCNQNFITPFHLVCESGNFKIAKFLIDRFSELEIDLDSKAFSDLTAFQMACMEGNVVTVVEFLSESD